MKLSGRAGAPRTLVNARKQADENHTAVILSEAELRAMMAAAADKSQPSLKTPWAIGLRRMLEELAQLDYARVKGTALFRLSDIGARYGLRELREKVDFRLWAYLSTKAKTSLRRDLRRDLARLTRPCLELERESFGLALIALGAREDAINGSNAERIFLGRKPAERLFSLFKKFPVLARLWFQSISQWRAHIMEVVTRFEADRIALSRAVLRDAPVNTIANVRTGLSDPHNCGRTVVELSFETGRVIYKPRSGMGESEWFALLTWMNSHSFRPKLRAARILRRNGYCWMEHLEPASCKSQAAVRRFYQRMGGMIAAAHLLKAVDCHRDNFIASGEYPILVDVDALWHVSPVTKTQSLSTVLYRTGFFPNSDPRSLQSRSSTLGAGRGGRHRAHIEGGPVEAALYTREIVSGFAGAWRCLLGTRSRRNTSAQRLRRIRSRKRRWIYWATEKYVAILRASIQPAVLRSGSERKQLIAGLCTRPSAGSMLVNAEVSALTRLDVPYFMRRSNEQMPPDQEALPVELIQAIQRALQRGT